MKKIDPMIAQHIIMFIIGFLIPIFGPLGFYRYLINETDISSYDAMLTVNLMSLIHGGLIFLLILII